jgi:5-methylcytosine-specific restriction endonuclease McrA
VQPPRRTTTKLTAEGDFTTKEFTALCEKYGNRCLSCGRDDVSLTPDHAHPLSLGGSNLVTNIQPLCNRRNSRNVKVLDYRPLTRFL